MSNILFHCYANFALGKLKNKDAFELLKFKGDIWCYLKVILFNGFV